MFPTFLVLEAKGPCLSTVLTIVFKDRPLGGTEVNLHSAKKNYLLNCYR